MLLQSRGLFIPGTEDQMVTDQDEEAEECLQDNNPDSAHP